jgi:hypothetical protein
MVFSLINYQPSTPEQQSPFGNLLSNALQKYNAMTQSQYLQPSLAEELKKAQLYNKWYEPNIKSEIGLRGAQAGHLGAETTALNISNPYLKQKLETEIALQKAQGEAQQALANKRISTQKLISNLLSGNNIIPQSTNTSNYNVNQEQSIPNIGGNLQPNNQMAQQSSSQINPLSYAQASVLSKELGLSQPKIIDVNGKQLAVTPFGNIEIAQGLTELQKKLAAKNADTIQGLDKQVISGTTKRDTLNEVSNILSNPMFEEMRQHPISGSYELRAYEKFGTPTQQQLAAAYKTYTGQIIKDAASDFKGQFRVGEQGLLNSMKPNDSDTADAARGKVEALALMNELLTKRSEVTSHLMQQGMNLVDASKKADSLMHADEIRSEIKNKLSSSNISMRKIRIKNQATGESKEVTVAEARKLGVPNV